MNEAQKPPTLEVLYQYERQQNQQLASSQSKNPAYFKEPIYLSSKQKLNPWEQISTLIEQSRAQLKELKSLPLKYRSAEYQHSADKIRNEISRNKLKKFRLQEQKKKRLQQQARQSRNLDAMLEELEKMQKQIQNSGITNDLNDPSQNGCNFQDSSKFRPIEHLLQNAPNKFKEQYLEPLKKSSFVFKPLELFNRLASKVMQTDRQISFLMSKKYEEQQAIQSYGTEYKILEKKQKNLLTQIEELKEQQVKYENELESLEKQLKTVNDPNYINLELVQRIQLQQKLYQEECKGMYMNIMKLRRLIELSGNVQAVKEAQHILNENKIVKSL